MLRQHSRVRLGGMVVLLGLSLGLMLESMSGDSATVDEFDHLAAGYAYLRHLDLRGLSSHYAYLGERLQQGPLANAGSYLDHPPLIRGIAALPLLFLDVHLPAEPTEGHAPLPTSYFYTHVNNPDRILFWSRLSILLLFTLLLLLIAKWARELYGPWAGLFALFLAALNTTLMAYGRYVTTDLGEALFYTLALYTFLRCLKKPSMLNLAAAGIAFGLAQVAKFSGVMLVPTFVVLAASHLLHRASREEGPSHELKAIDGAHVAMETEPKKGSPRILREALQLLTALVTVWGIGLLVIAAVYSVQTWHLSTAEQAAMMQALLGHGRTAQFVVTIASASKPLGQYVLGLVLIALHNQRGNLNFFWGHVTKTGWPEYFPVAFLLKTQIPLMLLLVLAPLFKKGKAVFEGWMLLLPAAIYVIIAMGSSINIGVRHLLPIYPLLIIWASQAVRWPLQRHVVSLSKATIIGGLALWYGISALAIHPHYLAYFNELIGGPQYGYQYLSDSNVDWGQDFKRLRTYLQEAGIEDVHIFCFDDWNQVWGCPEVTYYLPHGKPWGAGAPFSLLDELPNEYFVIGKTPRAFLGEWLKPEARPHWKNLEQQLARLQPVHTIGYSIDLYDLRQSEERGSRVVEQGMRMENTRGSRIEN